MHIILTKQQVAESPHAPGEETETQEGDMPQCYHRFYICLWEPQLGK